MTQPTRPEGYYWVKRPRIDKPDIAEWDGELWYLSGQSTPFMKEDFESIGGNYYA